MATNKEAVITIRVKPQMKEELEQKAQIKDMRLSELIRDIFEEYLNK